MTGILDADVIGPVDVAVIAFDGNRFNGDVAPAIAELQENGTVRIIDLTFVSKDVDGVVTMAEISDSDIADAFERLTTAQFDLLSEDDLNEIAEDLPPNSSAMVVVWENTWAARLGASLRESSAEIVEIDRIPREVVLAAITALDA